MDSSGNCIERYQQGMMIDGVAGRQIGQGTLSDRFIKDHLGSVQRVIRENGVEENEYIYDSFGNIVYQSGTLSNQRLYTSRYYDSESGLYYYRARYYDSNTGRFISEDPVGFAGGINLFLYGTNNAMNERDPLGLIARCVKEWIGVEERNFRGDEYTTGWQLILSCGLRIGPAIEESPIRAGIAITINIYMRQRIIQSIHDVYNIYNLKCIDECGVETSTTLRVFDKTVIMPIKNLIEYKTEIATGLGIGIGFNIVRPPLNVLLGLGCGLGIGI